MRRDINIREDQTPNTLSHSRSSYERGPTFLYPSVSPEMRYEGSTAVSGLAWCLVPLNEKRSRTTMDHRLK